MSAHNTRVSLLVVTLVMMHLGVPRATQDAPPTTSGEEAHTILDIDTIAGASTTDSQLVGREVAVADVEVAEVLNHGFWVVAKDGKQRVFVVPAEGSLIRVRRGEFVSLHGEVRLAVTRPDAHAGHIARLPNTAYIYAYTVRPAW